MGVTPASQGCGCDLALRAKAPFEAFGLEAFSAVESGVVFIPWTALLPQPLLTLEDSMSLFRRPDYKSETSQFIDQLKATHPQLENQQRQGRLLLWDQPMDAQLWDEFAKGKVAQKPYVYQTNG